MPPPQSKAAPAPDFIAAAPDFIPASGNAPLAPPDERNGVQRFMDNLTTVTPEQDAKTPGILKPLAHFGAGAIEGATSPFVHPLKTLEGVGTGVSALLGDEGSADQIVNGVKSDPAKMLGNMVGGADLGGVAAEAGAPLIAKIPNKARAVQTLNEVSQAAHDVPVQMTETDPALQGFRQYVDTGGRGTPVINKLVKRLADEDQGPVNFPEARQFYTNVSRATARPGFLRRAIESPAMPDMRRNLGSVREGMNADLTNAADSVGMGDKYTQGIREYGNAAKLNHAMKIGGTIATEEALRRSGILGKVFAGVTGQ